MIRLSRVARRHVSDLATHYERLKRPDAARNLIAAIDEAEARIEADPHAGIATPRPYPALAREGHAWIKAGRYWIGYRLSKPPTIVAVFYETADIQGRIDEP